MPNIEGGRNKGGEKILGGKDGRKGLEAKMREKDGRR
jgi:hypothetical protein